MKQFRLLLSFTIITTLFSSCYTEVIVDDFVNEPRISINQILSAYELWYVDINATKGFGESPFLQKAFTISFKNGVLYANNNLVGLGNNGNGYGIDVANYDAYNMILNVNHDLDGFATFDVFQVNNNTIELYNPNNDTSYFLNGYQRNNFDYDFVFYDNIHYFLQEYETWEKTYTSDLGVLNEFDNENYLRFITRETDYEFQSSQDFNVSNINTIFWDYSGLYGIGNTIGNDYLKTLTLNYDSSSNDFFELSVINDNTIKLFHAASKTTYEFKGRGYIPYLKPNHIKSSTQNTQSDKKRKFRKNKIANPRVNSRV